MVALFPQAVDREPCAHALELVVMFAITTPDIYDAETVDLCKAHVHQCRACWAFLDSFGKPPPPPVALAPDGTVVQVIRPGPVLLISPGCPVHGGLAAVLSKLFGGDA